MCIWFLLASRLLASSYWERKEGRGYVCTWSLLASRLLASAVPYWERKGR